MATFGLKLYNTADFVLTSANGIYVKQPISDDISSKTYPVQIPRRHGGKVDDYPKLGPRVINLIGLIQGSTKEIYRTNVETFAKNLKYGKQKFYKFDDRYIWVNNSSLSIRDGPTMLWGDFSAELVCIDPFWYALAESSSIFNASETSLDFILTINTGGDLITNGAFTSDTTGWTAVTATLSSVAGGQSDNCLQVASSGANAGRAYQDITTVVGQVYKLLVYFKKGTSDTGSYHIGTTGDYTSIYSSPALSDATWTRYNRQFTATATTTRISFRTDDATNTETSFFDTVTVYLQTAGNLGNSATPIRITLTAGSTVTNPTFNNLTSSKSFSYTGTGTSFIFNGPDYAVTVGGSNALSNFTGEFWDLLSVTNSIRFTQSAAISAVITVYWTDRWY